MTDSLIDIQRKDLHRALINEGLYVITDSKYGRAATNSDAASLSSRRIGLCLAEVLGVPEGKRMAAQTIGSKFEELIADYVDKTFTKLQHLRPGWWKVEDLGNRGHAKAESFAQYEHLAHLAHLTETDRGLKTALGNDYVVSPDVVVSRHLVTDEEINVDGRVFVGDESSLCSDIRQNEGKKPILHASISAKWTIRSDRAQNSRTEALNLIRNRKGRLPHIVVVTNEPVPERIASLALGTGDIDCVYHVALYELQKAVSNYSVATGTDASLEMLSTLIEGKRLKDISDLPLDLCV